MNQQKTILNNDQIKILDLISKEKFFTENFYLGGGTALAEYYLHHRLSEDLDFFSENEFDPSQVSAFFSSIKNKVGIVEVAMQQSFNRNLFFLKMKEQEIKTEFTYYPFTRVQNGLKVGSLQIDSLWDIAVNKVFTIFQKPRSRDFIDLYCILQNNEDWRIADLIKDAQIKFGNYIDPLQLAAQCQKADSLLDYPTMLIDLPKESWINFFLSLSKELVNEEVI